MIRRIEALNYRSLRYVAQNLGPFEVLVGPNASGKSTFLDVVSLVRDFVRDGLDEGILGCKERGVGRASLLDELIFNQSANHFEVALEMHVPNDLVHSNDVSGTAYRYDSARYELAIGKAD